jgi:4-amino-4-deoxy-L-arabinose transferase-like glycosyltransferase
MENRMGMQRTHWERAAWLLAFALGALLRLQDVGRPFDSRTLAPWRESDYVGIARSFARETIDPFHPRVDWRGDTPGFAEMELPVLPYAAGLLDRVFGEDERRMRWLAAIAGVAGLFAFAGLARAALPGAAAPCAALLFAVQPLAIHLSPAIQPDGWMLLFVMLAVRRLWRFEEGGSGRDLILAALLTSVAALFKAPGALVGLLLAEAVLRRRGLRGAFRPDVLAAAACALVPAGAWYAWSHRFWLEYGLSLGLSDETHCVNLAVLSSPAAFLQNLREEFHHVFSAPGFVLAAVAFVLPSEHRARLLRFGGAVALFYFVALDTSGDAWAFYYHALSSAPAVLLMGAGFGALLDHAARARPRRPRVATVASASAWVLAIAAAAVLLHSSLELRRERDEGNASKKAFLCAQEFRAVLPPDARIVAAGGRATDEHGHPVAHNASTWFAWLDRRGATYADGEATLARLDEFARRGPTWWIAAAPELADAAFRAAVDARHRLVVSCGGAYRLYELVAGR